MRKILLVALVAILTIGTATIAYGAYQQCSNAGVCNGTAGADRIDGTDGYDVIYGGAGRDVIQPGLGDDYVEGGDGRDLINDAERNDRGTNDEDTIYAEEGDDTINAADGDDASTPQGDIVNCGSGNDIAYVDYWDSPNANCETVIVIDGV